MESQQTQQAAQLENLTALVKQTKGLSVGVHTTEASSSKRKESYRVYTNQEFVESSEEEEEVEPEKRSPVLSSPAKSTISTIAPSLYANRIILTTYPGQTGILPIGMVWGAADPLVRGPIVASRHPDSIKIRNATGAHGGSYSIYRALAVAMGELPPTHRPNLQNTYPVVNIGPFPSWGDPTKIVSLDPFGHIVGQVFADYVKEGVDIRPTIAITKAHMQLAELEAMVKDGYLKVDGKVCLSDKGQLMVVKGAVEPVWYLPGIASRFQVDETTLRRALFEDTGGMYPELITR